MAEKGVRGCTPHAVPPTSLPLLTPRGRAPPALAPKSPPPQCQPEYPTNGPATIGGQLGGGGTATKGTWKPQKAGGDLIGRQGAGLSALGATGAELGCAGRGGTRCRGAPQTSRGGFSPLPVFVLGKDRRSRGLLGTSESGWGQKSQDGGQESTKPRPLF